MHQNPLEGLLKFKVLGPSTRVSASVGLGGGCLVTELCLAFVTPWTVAHQAPLSLGFPRQEYQSGLPFPSPGDLSS